MINFPLFSKIQFLDCFQVAALCAQNSPDNRPTMLEVVEMLKGDATDPSKQSLPEKANGALKIEPVKYDPALLAADETPGYLGSRKSALTTG